VSWCLGGKTGDDPSPKISLPPFVLGAAIFIAARLWHLTTYGIFGDEVFTFWTSAQGWRGLLSSVVGDVVHPPLFYVLLKVWIGLGGESVLWLKLLPVLISVLTLIPFVLLCRELRLGSGPMNLALWLIAVNGFLINHGQELRMYSLLLLLTVTSLWLFAKLINGETRIGTTQAFLCGVNLLMVFTQYFGWIIVALELVFLVVWKRERLRGFAIGVIFLALCFSPWVWFVAKAAHANPSRLDFVWNRPPPASELVGFYGNLNGALSYRWKIFGTALVMVVVLTPVIVWGWRVLRRGRAGSKMLGLPQSHEDSQPHEGSEAVGSSWSLVSWWLSGKKAVFPNPAGAMTFWWLALFALAPVALAFVASHILPQPVWAFRYLIIAAPAYLLLVAVAPFKLNSPGVRVAAIVVILGWSGASGFTEVIDRDRIAWEPLVHRLIQTERESKSGIRIYVTDSNVGNTIQFYLDRAMETQFQPVVIENLNLIPENYCWVAFVQYKHENHMMLQTELTAAGYTVGDIIESETSGDKAVLFPVWKKEGAKVPLSVQ